jgi:hypothetical protein
LATSTSTTINAADDQAWEVATGVMLDRVRNTVKVSRKAVAAEVPS